MTQAEEIEYLKAENASLREALENREERISPAWCSRRAWRRLLGALMANDHCSRDHLHSALYWDRDEFGCEKIIDAQICLMRQWLRPQGVEIKTVWGVGYSLPPEAKRRISELMEALRCP